MRSSSSAARGPVVSQPERSVSTTAAISSSPIAGGWKPSLVLRGGRIDLEAYGLRRTASPGHRGGGVVPGGQDRAGPVGATAERPEAPPGLPVGPHPLDALDRLGLLDPDGLGAARPPARRGRGRTPHPPRPPAAEPPPRPPPTLVTLCHKASAPRANERARSLRSIPVAARQSSASWPPPSRAATSTT